jgi:hypothetical protein
MYVSNPPILTQRTVIVLGAGASCGVGYPTNADLVGNICRKFSRPNQYRDIALEAKLFSENDIESFVRDLSHSQYESIDQFLKDRPKYETFGRFAIAMEIIFGENEDPLMEMGRRSWYLRLRTIIGNTPSSHKLSIITFNYDRSLEHYLYRAIKAATDWTDEKIAAEIGSLGILHVHGHVGALPWQSSEGRWYDNNLKGKDFFAASKEIVLAHDGPNEALTNSLQGLVENADRIYFFGFGFHHANLLKLGLPVRRDNFGGGDGKSRFMGASTTNMRHEDLAALKKLYPRLKPFTTIEEGLTDLVQNGTAAPVQRTQMRRVLRFGDGLGDGAWR